MLTLIALVIMTQTTFWATPPTEPSQTLYYTIGIYLAACIFIQSRHLAKQRNQ
jgi:hypothetical protein